MMADIKNNQGAGVDAPDSDSGSEDGDDDEGPPPLEDAEITPAAGASGSSS